MGLFLKFVLISLLSTIDLLGEMIQGQMLGPADATYITQTDCDSTVNKVDVKIIQRAYNRTTKVFDINFFSPYVVDDSMEIGVKVSVKKDGGYKPGYNVMQDTFCKVLRTVVPPLFNKLLDATGREDCPLPEGLIEIVGFHFDNKKFTKPQLYGERKTELFLYKDRELVHCSILYYEFVPKS